MIAEVFRGHDLWGREIVLTEGCGYNHILANHPVMSGNETCLPTTLAAPHCVMHDATHPHREIFYRLGAVPSVPHLYLKVCVEFLPPESGGADGGKVVTAFPTGRFKPKERQ